MVKLTDCQFSTYQLEKVVRACGCFVHFELEMCFAPQPRAIFRHLNFKKCSENAVFCTFNLGVFFAPQRRTIFISALTTWLRTRRFSEPTFRPSEPTNHGENTVIRDFPGISHHCIFFLLTLLLCSAFQLSILSEVGLLNFLRLRYNIQIICSIISADPAASGGARQRSE